MHKVFTYGTLKKGFRNAFYLEAAKLIGTGVVAGTLHTFSGGNFPFPALRPGTTKIRGELYEDVTDGMVEDMDYLEGHPHFFRRQKVTVVLDDGTVHEGVWAYFFTKELPEETIIPEGEWPPRVSRPV